MFISFLEPSGNTNASNANAETYMITQLTCMLLPLSKHFFYLFTE